MSILASLRELRIGTASTLHPGLPTSYHEVTMYRTSALPNETRKRTIDQQGARSLRDELGKLDRMLAGRSGVCVAANDAAESVIEVIIGFRERFDADKRKAVREEVERYKRLCEWMQKFDTFLEEELEKKVSIERAVSELPHELQEEEGINPPPSLRAPALLCCCPEAGPGWFMSKAPIPAFGFFLCSRWVSVSYIRQRETDISGPLG